jgi:hypothetical protein
MSAFALFQRILSRKKCVKKENGTLYALTECFYISIFSIPYQIDLVFERTGRFISALKLKCTAVEMRYEYTFTVACTMTQGTLYECYSINVFSPHRVLQK